jgi:type IX secretion system PorP/SprF family membrane protein
MFMLKRLSGVLICLFGIYGGADCQEPSYGHGYQTILINNPAFAGSEGNGNLKLSYLNYYPGNNFNFHSLFASYDSYIPILHGGAGMFLSDDYLGGIINDMRGGFSYSYHLQAGRDSYINAGLTASFYHRGYNRSNIIMPEQIDPLNGVVYPSGEIINIRGRTVLDIGAGFLFIRGKFLGGFSLTHLAQPDLSGTGNSADRLKRKISMNFSTTFDIGKKMQMAVRPYVFSDIQGKMLTTGAGGSIETEIISFNSLFIVNNRGNIDLQTGFSFKKGIMLLFYSYCFNIASENHLLPVSLFHQAGVAVSLNNVDKRKIIKTINFPNL